MKSFLLPLTLLIAIAASSPLSAQSASPDLPKLLQDSPLDNGLTYNDDKANLTWYDGSRLTIFGKGFHDTPGIYSRLPARAKGTIPEVVWNLSKNTTGIGLHFISDMKEISASWRNSTPMGHMAYSGSGGLDLYKKVGDEWIFAGVGVPSGTETTKSLTTYTKLDGQVHEYMLYLPLYSSVKYVKLGINPEARLAPAPKQTDKPIVFYGTSITQGGCASRSGMSHPAILGRWLNKEVINLGFSGSGKSEEKMAEYISEIDAEIFVLEPIPNMNEELVNERSYKFAKILRDKHPKTPILFVLAPTVPDDNPNNAAFKKVYDTFVSHGDKNVYLLKGKGQFDGLENPTVDGVHPTDLGFYRMAKAYEPVLKKILANKSKK